MDRYRDRRSPDRERPRYPPPTDSYVPSSSRSTRPRSRSASRYRPRPRTPPRVQADTWRGRPRSRSPPRRYDSRVDAYPPRDVRPRSPRREYSAEPRYDEEARQSRARSPIPLKRPREPTPVGRGARSPQPVKRERVSSPPRDYARPRSPPRRAYPSPPPASRAEFRPRSRSPPRRDDRSDQYTSRPYRRRSPSPKPVKLEVRSGEASGRDSVATSRRSSPRPLARKPDGYEEPRATYRSPPRTRSPLPMAAPQRRDEPPPTRAMSPPRPADVVMDSRAPPPSERAYPTNGEPRAPPTGPSNRDGRAPPTGPASSLRYGPASAGSPPLGPAAASVSMSAHNRPSSAFPPSYPRGGGGYRGRGGPPLREFPSRDYPTGPSSVRGGRGWGPASSFGRGGGPRDAASPRDSYAGDARPGPGPPRSRESTFAPPPPGFRGSTNSTSTTYPRTQRFNTSTPTSAHLADLPAIKPGGELLPPLQDMSKADRLEEEAARLRKLIDEKQGKKREAVRDWESLERQSKTAGLRTELAEEGLRGLSDEGTGVGVGGVAAF